MIENYKNLKEEIKNYLIDNFKNDSTILDIGCGKGENADLLYNYFGKFDGVEIKQTNIENFNLKEKYNNIWDIDIINFEFEYYDIIIVDDILKHLTIEDSKKLINKLKNKCKELLFIIPFNIYDSLDNKIDYPQGNLNFDIMYEFYYELDLLNYKNIDYKIKQKNNDDTIGYYTVFVKKEHFDEKIILTMTTIPNRLIGESFKLVIDRLTTLSYKNYELHLNIPYINKKTNEEYIIPKWLSNYNSNNLKIYRCDDYGSITKILPTILRITDPEQIIITVDDDLLYMDGFIEYHLKKRKYYVDDAIGFAGISAIDGYCHFCTTIDKDVRIKILEGYKTVSYKRKFFGDDFEEFVKGSWADDITLSAYMGKNNIKKYVVNYYGDIDYSARVESFPVVRILPNEFGGCNIFRIENIYDNSSEYHKIGYLER